MDWFDDFDDIENEDIMDEDSFEDSLEENLEMDDEPIEAESQDDDFTAKDTFFWVALWVLLTQKDSENENGESGKGSVMIQIKL